MAPAARVMVVAAVAAAMADAATAARVEAEVAPVTHQAPQAGMPGVEEAWVRRTRLERRT